MYEEYTYKTIVKKGANFFIYKYPYWERLMVGGKAYAFPADTEVAIKPAKVDMYGTPSYEAVANINGEWVEGAVQDLGLTISLKSEIKEVNTEANKKTSEGYSSAAAKTIQEAVTVRNSTTIDAQQKAEALERLKAKLAEQAPENDAIDKIEQNLQQEVEREQSGLLDSEINAAPTQQASSKLLVIGAIGLALTGIATWLFRRKAQTTTIIK